MNCEWSGCCHIVTGSIFIVHKSACIITCVLASCIVNKQICLMCVVPWSLKSFTILKFKKCHATFSNSLLPSILCNFHLFSPNFFYLKPLDRCCPIVEVNGRTKYFRIFFWSRGGWIYHVIWNIAIWLFFIYSDIHISSLNEGGTIKKSNNFLKVT